MNQIDYIVLAVYFILMAAAGIIFFRKKESLPDYFLAGRSMGWFAIGLSVMGTAFSAINFTAFPTEVFSFGLYVAVSLPVFILVAWPITRVFIPFYHRMCLTSVYEYLEKRFDLRVRVLASGIFILWAMFWMAVMLYATGKMLAAFTGGNLVFLIIITGVVTTFYTSLGGMRAVMWTDVIQFFVLAAAIVLAVVFAAGQQGGFTRMFEAGHLAGKLKPFYPVDAKFFSWDPTMRISLWSGLIGTFVAFLGRYGAEQVIVQRYFTARSLKEAQRGFWCNVVSILVVLILLLLLGLAINVYAGLHGKIPGNAEPLRYMVQLFKSLPIGMVGLVAAGLLSATMSSIDSGLNSCVTAYVVDFDQRLFKRAGNSAVFSKVLTGLFGLGAIGLTFVVGRLGTIFAITNKIVNGVSLPLLALVLVAMFSRSAHSRGVFWGGITGTVFSLWVSLGLENIALHYYAVLNLLGTAALCLIFSMILPNRDKDHAKKLQWTWAQQRSTKC